MNVKLISTLIAALAAGMAVAALTIPVAASAYTTDQLPNLGYQVSVMNLGNNCHDWTVSGYGASADLGSDCDAGFQATLDAFVQRTCPCAQTTTTTTTAAATTATVATTTTAVAAPPPSTVTTTAAPSAPVTTDTTATASAPAPAAAPAATDTTATAATAPAPTTTDTTTCDVQCQIADLQSQINAIRSELVQLIQILEQWPGIDPGILAQLMALPQ